MCVCLCVITGVRLVFRFVRVRRLLNNVSVNKGAASKQSGIGMRTIKNSRLKNAHRKEEECFLVCMSRKTSQSLTDQYMYDAIQCHDTFCLISFYRVYKMMIRVLHSAKLYDTNVLHFMRCGTRKSDRENTRINIFYHGVFSVVFNVYTRFYSFP